MRQIFLLPAAAALLLAACSGPDAVDPNLAYMEPNLTYPVTRVDSAAVDTLWGVAVPDPYRWLEDDRSEETGAWVDAQNAVTRAFLDSIPVLPELRARYEALYNYEKIGMPRRIGSRYYVAKNDGLQNQSVWYVRDSINGPDRVFLDPNALIKD